MVETPGRAAASAIAKTGPFVGEGRQAHIAVGPPASGDRTIKDEAIVFRNALAARGVGLQPEQLEPIISTLFQELDSPSYTGSSADYVQTLFASEGINPKLYQQILRERVLREKLSPQWLPTDVEELVVQEIRTDSRQKAEEAVQRGRAGTPFVELLRTYQMPSVPIAANDNTLTTPIVLPLRPDIKAALPTVQEGAYSNPIPTADNSQFQIYRIVRITKRPPVEGELDPIYEDWLSSFSRTFPVVYVDKSLQPPVAPR